MMNSQTVCAAVGAVSLGVTVGLLASSASSLYSSTAVSSTTPPVVAAPSMRYSANLARGITNVRATQEEAAVVIEAPALPQSGTWTFAAVASAGVALGAAMYGLQKKAHGVYETIKDDPEAVFSGAGKALGAAVVSAAVAASASAASLTYDEIQSLSYLEVKGSGLANTCPVLADSTGNKLALKAGSYKIDNLCLEPSSFQIKVPPTESKAVTEFEKTKLMTRLTYTLDGIRADLTVGGDGSWTIKELDGIDYAATTVQLAGGERVPFLFTIKNLAAKGDAGQFLGQFDVPSYRGATFLDPKGRGGATGYDTAVALPAAGDDEEYAKENSKSTAASVGTIAFKVAKVNAQTGEIAGVFESIQPSDTDLGAKVPKDVKTSGVWYGQISPA